MPKHLSWIEEERRGLRPPVNFDAYDPVDEAIDKPPESPVKRRIKAERIYSRAYYWAKKGRKIPTRPMFGYSHGTMRRHSPSTNSPGSAETNR